MSLEGNRHPISPWRGATDGTVLRHWSRVARAESHPAEVAAFLEKL